MDKIKEILPRLLLWISCLCLPAAVGLMLVDSSSEKNKIPELAELENGLPKTQVPGESSVPQVSLAPTPTPVPSAMAKLGMEIAREESEEHKKLRNGISKEIEDLIAFLSRTQAQQTVIFKEQVEEIKKLNEHVVDQKGKVEMLLQLTHEQDEKIKSLTLKMNDLDKRVTDKSQHDQVSLEKLTKMYSSLPAGNVVKITADMEVDTLAKILSGMKEKNLSDIILALPPKRAAAVTLKLGNFSGAK